MRLCDSALCPLPFSGSTYSALGDPWPLNPASDNQSAFVSYLWQNGAEIFVEVDRCVRAGPACSGSSLHAQRLGPCSKA